MKKAIFIFWLMGAFLIVRAQNCDTNLFPNGHAYYDTYHEFAGTPALWEHYNLELDTATGGLKISGYP